LNKNNFHFCNYLTLLKKVQTILQKQGIFTKIKSRISGAADISNLLIIIFYFIKL